MLPTPSTSHVNYDQVYEPAEDSYLLLDTLSSLSERQFLATRFPPNSPALVVLEVGTGSGVVLGFATAHAGRLFGRADVAALGTDVNSFACRATAETVKQAVASEADDAGTLLGCLTGDLACAIRPGMVDVLIFNPPYVPTEDVPAQPSDSSNASSLTWSAKFERDSHLLSLSYAGGADGMETTDRLLAQIPEVLSSRGIAYILLCAQNKPDQVAARIHAWSGDKWHAIQANSSGKQAGWEKLCVLRIWREEDST